MCKGETVGKIGEVDEMGEMGERELVSAKMQQKTRHDTWMTIVLRRQRCAILSFAALDPCVMKCDAQLFTCCFCGCTFHTPRRISPVVKA